MHHWQTCSLAVICVQSEHSSSWTHFSANCMTHIGRDFGHNLQNITFLEFWRLKIYRVNAFFWQSSTLASGEGVAKSKRYLVGGNWLIRFFEKIKSGSFWILEICAAKLSAQCEEFDFLRGWLQGHVMAVERRELRFLIFDSFLEKISFNSFNYINTYELIQSLRFFFNPESFTSLTLGFSEKEF